MFVSSTGYFLFKAASMIEMSQTFYVSLVELAALVHFAIQFWKITKMAELIDTIDELLEKSSLKHFFAC